jgi:cell division protein ZapA (FtsZ GTPase activity inhibitor)
MAEISINIKIHTRTYKITIDSNNEATVRKATSDINEKINSLKKQFPSQDDQDYLSMALIDYITSSSKPTTTDNTSNISEKITALHQLLSE